MARCNLCNKYLGLGIFSKWVSIDKVPFCQPCSEQYRAQRRQAMVEAMFQGGPPSHLATVRGVRTCDPDKLSKDTHWIGMMSFLDKGICLLQLAQSATSFSGGLGGIGRMAAVAIANYQGTRDYKDSERDILTKGGSFATLLENANDLMFYPRTSIRKMRVHFNGVTLYYGKFNKRFTVTTDKSEFDRLKPLLKAYQKAIETGDDIVAACSRLQVL